MRAVAALLGMLALGAAPPPGIAEQAGRLKAANVEARAAAARSRALQAAAAQERDAAVKARREEAAVAARIAAGEAELRAATARVAIVTRLLDDQRARLTQRQAPIRRLVAALQAFARRPAAAGVLQPGSLDDSVHVRALLGAILPVIAARTAAVRVEIARARALQADAALAARALAEGRTKLESERLALAKLEGEHRLRSQSLARGALFESDRAIALGERARDIVDLMAATEQQAATREDLAALAGPLPRPAAADERQQPRFATPPYRLPVAGSVVTGFGELGGDGVRSRGITLAPPANATVTAPAAGRVVFARRFRRYGIVVILDHGAGWTSALTGLGEAAVRPGAAVQAGMPIGRASAGDAPRVTLELRRRGVAMDLAALL